MVELAFKDSFKLFDGNCVRFNGFDGDKKILCGVTTYALKHHSPELPEQGLLPGELFLVAYDNFMIQVHQVAREKYKNGEFELSGDIKVLVHDTDWSKYLGAL
jgi:hypothetical protein